MIQVCRKYQLRVLQGLIFQELQQVVQPQIIRVVGIEFAGFEVPLSLSSDITTRLAVDDHLVRVLGAEEGLHLVDQKSSGTVLEKVHGLAVEATLCACRFNEIEHVFTRAVPAYHGGTAAHSLNRELFVGEIGVA